jgi:hypothetical protein
LSDNFAIHDDQGDNLTPLLFNFALEYSIWRVQENQMGLKLNGTHRLLAYADHVNLLSDDIDAKKRKTDTLNYGIWEVGLEINVEKSMYVLLSRR